MPGFSGEPVVTTLVCLLPILHARLWVQRAPGIPHALYFRGEGFMHNSGASRRGDAELRPMLFEKRNPDAKSASMRASRAREQHLPLKRPGVVRNAGKRI
jgi:hypothetical protein